MTNKRQLYSLLLQDDGCVLICINDNKEKVTVKLTGIDLLFNSVRKDKQVVRRRIKVLISSDVILISVINNQISDIINYYLVMCCMFK